MTTRAEACAAAAAQLVTEDDSRDSLGSPEAVAGAAWTTDHPMSKTELAAYYAALRDEKTRKPPGGSQAA